MIFAKENESIKSISWFRGFFQVLSVYLLLIFLFSAGVAAESDVSDVSDDLYHRAVVDAAFPEQDEITSKLIPIVKDSSELLWNADKSKVLVTTWKSTSSYEQFLKPHSKTSENPDHAVWVTAVPQVKRVCGAMFAANPKVSQEAVELRLKQYLGLNPDWQYDIFVEMWVNPADLFRPCVDPQIKDTSCNLHFGENIPTVKNIPDYRKFYENLYYKSYRSGDGVPWTGLGYTYDWGNSESEVGASEYILVPGASYEIQQVVSTVEYCKE